MTLSDDELRLGYWPARQMRGEIRSALQRPDQYSGSSVLNIACTQTGLTRSLQKKLVDEWCALLPGLPVRTLVFSSKVPQCLFDAACSVPQLDALSIKWSSITSLSALSEASSLRALFLGSSPSIDCLGPLSDLRGLEHLFIEGVQAPVDLSFVEGLSELREFGLAAARGRRMQVRTLKPLASLPQLELVWLVSLHVLDDGLTPLHALSNLKSLRTTINPRSRALQELCSAVPTLKYFQPVG